MRKVLIVEDEDILRETYEIMLGTLPIHVDSAENGRVALEKCNESSYDLILLDIMMPIMNGIEFLQAFMPTAPSQTRVIIMSNLSSGIELETALKLGATQNVLKAEMSPKQLLAMVRYEIGAE